jgi:CO dehydrogenase/acetyl-CoA synthase delta subunit
MYRPMSSCGPGGKLRLRWARTSNASPNTRTTATPSRLVSAKESLDGNSPKDLVAGTVDIIKRRYPGAAYVQSLAAAQRDGASTTLVVDIQTKAAMYPGDHSTVELVIIAFDAAQNPVSRITARASIQIKPYVPPNIRQAYDQALGELSRKADRLLN